MIINNIFWKVAMIIIWMGQPFMCKGQNDINSKMLNFPKIYAFQYQYGNHLDEYFKSGILFPVRILSQSMIDPNKDQKVDTEVVKKYLNRYYPNKGAEGLCILDWESDAFRDLRDHEIGEREFEVAITEYIKLVEMVKELRPNLQVSVYGLPFRFYYPSQKRYNRDGKLDEILRRCDFIAPSLYILFTDKQIGNKKNIAYLRENLKVAFQYSKRLRKPVIPFVWYRIHPSNRHSAWAIIPKDQMIRYLSFIAQYNYGEEMIDGIIWWEQNIPTNKTNIFNGQKVQLTIEERSALLIDYATSLVDSVKN